MSDIVFREIEEVMSQVIGEDVEILSSRTLGGGCINHASKIKTTAGDWFLKWNASCPDDMFEREAEGLKELYKGASSELKIPKVLCYKDVTDSPGFLVTEFLERGNTMNDDEKLGRGLAIIHQLQNLKFGFFHDNYCGDTPQKNTFVNDWITFFRENRIEYLLRLIEQSRGLSSSELKIYNQLLERLPLLIPEDSIPVLIHGDLWSGNYMLSSAGPALIDPAAYYADREMEFAIVTMFGGFSKRFYDSYNEVFPLKSDWQERNKLYQIYHILNHYHLFGGSYGSQALRGAKSYL